MFNCELEIYDLTPDALIVAEALCKNVHCSKFCIAFTQLGYIMQGFGILWVTLYGLYCTGMETGALRVERVTLRTKVKENIGSQG